MVDRDVVITGIGLVSSLGVGNEAHLARLTEASPRPTLDTGRYPPYTIHPLPDIDWSAQIPKKGDQRQMETWQRLGVYAAGLALDDAGVKGDEALCATMDMVVAAGGGERDEAVDSAILAASTTRNDHDVLLNERLTVDLRPTLFLAQLSNLLAGNISIVHKVTGSSRTFMGEEGSGISALETAAARIRSGQSSHVLVGGSFQTEHPDMLLGFELGGYLHRTDWVPVWQRAGKSGGGVVTGSGGAFLVLEDAEQAKARGRKPYARLRGVASSQVERPAGDPSAALRALIDQVAPSAATIAIASASGAHAATAAEKSALDHLGIPYRGIATLTGHVKEAQFPFSVGIAALLVAGGKTPVPFDSENETPFEGRPESALVTVVGYHRAEGVALVEAA